MKKGSLILILLSVFLLLTSCSEEYCPESDYLDARGNLEKFEEEVFLIVATSNQLQSTELEPVVEELDTYLGYIKKLDAPPCLEEAKSYLLKMTKNDLEFVENRFETGLSISDEDEWVSLFSGYIEELERLEECMPNCEP